MCLSISESFVTSILYMWLLTTAHIFILIYFKEMPNYSPKQLGTVVSIKQN